jgi:hypothetical protein
MHFAPVAATMPDTEAAEDNGDGDLKKPKTWLTAKHVPYIMATHDCLGTMAAGMTIKCVVAPITNVIRYGFACMKSSSSRLATRFTCFLLCLS